MENSFLAGVAGACIYVLIKLKLAVWTNYLETKAAKWCCLAAVIASVVTTEITMLVASLLCFSISLLFAWRPFYQSRYYIYSELIVSIMLGVILVLPLSILFNDGSVIQGFLAIKYYLFGILLAALCLPKDNIYLEDMERC